MRNAYNMGYMRRSRNSVIDRFKSYARTMDLTKENFKKLLQSVSIYPGKRMDIKRNLGVEIQTLMDTLRQETYTA